MQDLIIPQTVCPHYGVLTVRLRSGVLRGVLGCARCFVCAGSHRVPFASTVCGRSASAGFWVILPGVRVRFEAKQVMLCVTGAGDRMVLEDVTWQGQGI